jgi:hypothetical protein
MVRMTARDFSEREIRAWRLRLALVERAELPQFAAHKLW